MVQIDLYMPLAQEMQLELQLHADPTDVPFVVLRLVHAMGMYGMQLVLVADSNSALHWHVFIDGSLSCVQVELPPHPPLLT